MWASLLMSQNGTAAISLLLKIFENKDNIPIITEKLKKILAKEKLTNVEFVKILSVNLSE
jgi:hypothetical protein